MERWKDFEQDLDARDKTREFWHGLTAFVALIAIVSLVGCERGPLYSPETQNALTLQPSEFTCFLPVPVDTIAGPGIADRYKEGEYQPFEYDPEDFGPQWWTFGLMP